MVTKAEAKIEIKKLIEAYNSKISEHEKASEQDIRLKLIDKLFKRLGWDLDGDENPEEVQREEGIRNEESKKKKADYVFRLNGVPKLVVEAKGIKGVNMSDEQWREQAVGYAYNLACSWTVLTNFKTTSIYYVDATDDTSIRKIYDIGSLEEFDKNFDILWLLSKESVKEDLLLKEAYKLGIKQRKEKVGKQLFEDLSSWRKRLSDDIRKKYSTKYKGYEIEEMVQKIIDRLIFIRKLEDLEIEERQLEQLIRKFSDKTNYYLELKSIFSYYHNKYNSGLFGEEGTIQECDQIGLDNEPIREVILGMYKPKGWKIEYNFAAIDADVLGNIYEQYLSFILKDTTKKTKLEGGRTHRKEQGIYYTPTYIVDYIVKNTVVEYVKNKEIDDILRTKVIDPACGSGSFLIKSFNEICKVIEEKMRKGERSKKSASFKDFAVDKKLDLHQKISILTGCIYGVDLDKKAVEIAQLNLLLKLLEGETAEPLQHLGQTKKLLPMLSNNIKNGNSLIDDESIAGSIAFNWADKTKGFGEIIQYNEVGVLKEGYGFDIVIGNPPYVRPEKVDKKEREYYISSGKYDKMFGRFDLYVLFIEKALKINKEQGLFSFIIPSSFLNQNYSKVLREWILKDFNLLRLIDLSDVKVFDNAEVQTCIPFIKKNNPTKNSLISISKLQKEEALENTKFSKVFQEKFLTIPQCMIRTDLNDKKDTIIRKISDSSNLFSDIFYTVIGSVPHDTKTGASKDRLISTKKESASFRQYIEGKDVSRYSIISRGIYLNYQPSMMHRPKFPELFENEKLIIRKISTKEGLLATYDKDNFYTNDTVSLAVPWHLLKKINIKGENINEDKIVNSTKFNLLYCLGLISSKLLNFYFKNVLSSNLNVYPEAIRNLPIKLSSESNQKEIISLVKNILSLKKRLNELGDKQTDERKQREKELKQTDEQIDQEVYKLYGITKEEQKVIEDSLN